MNKKCGLCGWRSDKCKNPNSIHYDEFRDKEDRCSTKVNKDPKVHYYWWNYDKDIPNYIEKGNYKMAICGYLRKVTTRYEGNVTCNHCLKEMEKRGIEMSNIDCNNMNEDHVCKLDECTCGYTEGKCEEMICNDFRETLKEYLYVI